MAQKVNNGIACNCKDTAGGRVRFATNSKKFVIYVERSEHSGRSNISRAGRDSFVLLEECEKEVKMVKTCIFEKTIMTKYTLNISLACDGVMHNYIIYFPT